MTAAPPRVQSSPVGQRRRGRAAGGGKGSAASPTDLVGAVVHEVGNLLAAARLSAHLLSGGGGEAERLALARDVEDLAAYAGALLAQLRPLLAESPPERFAVPAAEVLGALRAALADRPAEGAGVEVAAGRGLPVVRVDPEALHQVLLALAYGAVEAVRPRGRVRVRGLREGRRVAIEFLDDGPPLDLPAVRRGPPPRGRELAVRVGDAVLRRMGGRVRAEARARGGTRLSALLPAVGGARASR